MCKHLDFKKIISASHQVHDHFQQCPLFFNIPDIFYGPVFAMIDIVPKNLAFDLKKGCENQGQCKNLDFVQIALVS